MHVYVALRGMYFFGFQMLFLTLRGSSPPGTHPSLWTGFLQGDFSGGAACFDQGGSCCNASVIMSGWSLVWTKIISSLQHAARFLFHFFLFYISGYVSWCCLWVGVEGTVCIFIIYIYLNPNVFDFFFLLDLFEIRFLSCKAFFVKLKLHTLT